MDPAVQSLLITFAAKAAPRILSGNFLNWTPVEEAIRKTEERFPTLRGGGAIKSSIRAWLSDERAARVVREINSGQVAGENAEQLLETFRENVMIKGLEEGVARNILQTFISELEKAALRDEDALWRLDQRFEGRLEQHLPTDFSPRFAEVEEAILGNLGDSEGKRTGEAEWHEQIDSARDLYRAGKPKSALEQYQQLLERLDDNDVHPHVRYRLHTNLGACYLARDNFQLARPTLLKALDYEPNGAIAEANLAQLALFEGDYDESRRRAHRALEIDPDSRTAANVLVQIPGEKAEEVLPDQLLDSPEVLTARGNYAANQQQLDRAEQLLSRALRKGERRPELLVILAEVLYAGLVPDATDFQVEAERIRRLATEALGEITDEQPRLKSRALLVRAAAWFDAEEAIPDLERAQRLDPESPHTQTALARAYARSGELDGAVYLLRSIPESDYSPVHHELMADVLGELGDLKEACEHLRAAASGAEVFPDSAYFRLGLAETAVRISDLDFARNLLEQIEGRVGNHRIAALRGRIAFQVDNLEEAREEYEKSIAEAPRKDVSEIQLECGVNFLAAGDCEEALEFLRAAYNSIQSDEAAQYLLQGLIETGRFPEATEILQEVKNRAEKRDSPLPDWALDMGSLVALSRDDTEEAIQFLEELIQREGKFESQAALRLCRVLVRTGEEERAREVLRDVNSSALEPENKMLAAELIQYMDGEEDPVMLAYEAVRRSPDDPELQMAYVRVFLRADRSEGEGLEADRVGEGTWVQLEGTENGEKADYLIVTDETSPGTFGCTEYSPESEVGRKLMGLTAGDEVDFELQTFRVKEVKSCLVHAFQQILLCFNTQHPTVGAMRKFKVGHPDSPRFFAPLIQQLRKGRESREQLLEFYDSRRVPLGMISEALSEPLWRAYFHLAQTPDAHLHVAHGTSQWQERSRQSAAQDAEVVLSVTGLLTLQELGRLGLLPELFDTLISPSSLQQELHDWLRRLKQHRADGGGMRMALGDAGPEVIEYDAEDLVPLIRRLEEIRNFVSDETSLTLRPTEFTGPEATRLRNLLGSSSFDSYALSTEDRVLFADDYGLLALAANEASVPGFSTYWLLLEASGRGLLETRTLNVAAADLINLNHFFVPVNAEMLLDVLSHDSYRFSEHYKAVLDRLKPHYANFERSAPVVVQFFKKLATAPLGGSYLNQAALEILLRMTEGGKPLQVLDQIENLTLLHLHLLPQHRDTVVEKVKQVRELRS